MSDVNTISQQIYDLLVSRDLDPSALDTMGKPSTSPADADLFSFDFKTEKHNYGTVVILLDAESNMEVYYGDNLGRGMDTKDKNAWYEFLYMIRMLAKRNMYTFSLNDMSKLKYNMATMAAVTEGTLLEGYYGTSKTSYSNQPKKTKLVIKHNKTIGEGEARYRNIQSIFVETDEGERFKLPFTNLTAAKAMARHVAEGGNPYDAFGQHITDMVNEVSILSKFNRAARTKNLGADAERLAEQAIEHYNQLKRKVKRIISRRGYHEEIENFDPITVTELDETVDAVREVFVQQSLDPRMEDALPILAKIQETNMKEVDAFESWASEIVEGTGTVAKTPQEIAQLKEIMAEPLPVGADALNASETIGFLLGGDDELQDDLEELAAKDPNADARPVIQQAIERLGIDLQNDEEIIQPEPEMEETVDIDSGEQVLKAQRDPMLEDELERLIQLIK